MNNKKVAKPINRNKIRLILGQIYFTYKRYLFWLFSKNKFVSKPKNADQELEFLCFSHQTPLLRKLKDVDMYLQYNKIINLNIALKKINYVIIKPGETLSYWKLIERPTKKKGYVEGMILQNGTFKPGIGGGLCQLSNLIYWITIHTPLTVVERHRHGYDVFPDSNRTQPFGSGATCFYNYGDLMIRNDTNQTFQLVFEIDDTYLKGYWKSDKPLVNRYEVYEKEHFINQEFWGYTRHNILYRKVYALDNNKESGELIDDEYVVENHAIMMYSPLLSNK